MKTFQHTAAQGDIIFVKLSETAHRDMISLRATPAQQMAMQPVKPDNGVLVLAHSETGHHHVMTVDRMPDGSDTVEMYRLPDSIYDCFLVVKEPTALTHLRDFDTHEPILFEPGTYQAKRQREYVPGEAQARMVQD